MRRMLGQFVGLPHTARVRRGWYADTLSDLRSLLRKGRVATAADDNGSLTVWRQRDNRYRCERYSYCRTEDSVILTSLSAVCDWWKNAIEDIQ